MIVPCLYLKLTIIPVIKMYRSCNIKRLLYHGVLRAVAVLFELLQEGAQDLVKFSRHFHHGRVAAFINEVQF